MAPKGKREKILPEEAQAEEAPVKKTRVETDSSVCDDAPTMLEEDRKDANRVEAREEELLREGEQLSGEQLKTFLQKNFLDFDVNDF